jgi:elongation factor G
MSNPLESQRTYALVGTGGCGKTSLAEMLLFQTGVINRLGAIEDGTTSLDYEPEEIRRRGTIQPGFATYLWNKNRHFLMDIAGDGNFIGDMACLLQGVDAAVFTIDAVDGVRPLTKKLWNMTRDAGLPALIFINKLDRDRADFNMAFNGLSAMLGIKPVALHVPVREGEDFKGYVDVFAGKTCLFDDKGKVREEPLPDSLPGEITALRDAAIENIAESDEALMEKYLEEGELSPEELDQGLRKGVLAGELVPVVTGAALQNKGGIELLHAIERLFPSPLSRAPFADAEGKKRISSESEPAACFVFKTIADPFAGQLSMIRVLSGTISTESGLRNMRSGDNERLGSLIYLTGKNQTPVKEALGPGAIVAAAKLKTTRTGDTLCDDKAPFVLPMAALPPQLITYALDKK